MHQTLYLADFITRQYDLKKFEKMIKAFLNLVDNFQLMVNTEEYSLKLTASYEIRCGGNKKPTSSKIESFYHNKYDTIEKKEQLLLKYRDAFNSLNEVERKVFMATFVNPLSNQELCSKLLVYEKKLTIIRKSAIVRFCLRLGFDRFVDNF